MDLDEIKGNWKDIDESSPKPKLKKDEIRAILNKNRTKNLYKVFVPEAMMLLLYAYLVLMLVVFNKQFDNLFHKGLSVFAIIILFSLSLIIFTSTRKFYNESKTLNSFSKTLDLLVAQCKKLNNLYYIILILNLILLVLCIILLPRVYAENPTGQQTLIAMLVGSAVLLLIFYKIYNYYYQLIKNNRYLLKRIERNSE